MIKQVKKGINAFCARAFLLPYSPKTALLWIALVPMSKDNLKEKLPIAYKSTNCPQIPVCLGQGSVRALRIKMMVEEKDGEGYGFWCYPLLDVLYTRKPMLLAE